MPATTREQVTDTRVKTKTRLCNRFAPWLTQGRGWALHTASRAENEEHRPAELVRTTASREGEPVAMDTLLAPWNALVQYERSFDGQVWIDYTRLHAEIPILAVAAYLVVVFYVPDFLRDRKPFNLKRVFALWNLFLAIFSTIGTHPLSLTTITVLVNRHVRGSVNPRG